MQALRFTSSSISHDLGFYGPFAKQRPKLNSSRYVAVATEKFFEQC